MKSQTRMGLAFHFVRTGLEPLGRSVKKTVLWTVFSDGSCGSSSVRFREAKTHQVPSLAPKRTALAGPVFSDGNCGSSSVRFREAKTRTVRNIVVSLAWSASRYSLFLPVRRHCFFCRRQRSAANQVPSSRYPTPVVRTINLYSTRYCVFQPLLVEFYTVSMLLMLCM